MLEAFAQPMAWGTPGGLGFFLLSLGILLWGISKLDKK